MVKRLKFRDTVQGQDMMEGLENYLESAVKNYWSTHRKPVRLFPLTCKISRKLGKLNISGEEICTKLDRQKRVKLILTENLAVWLLPFEQWEKLEPRDRFLLIDDLTNGFRDKKTEEKKDVNKILTKKFFGRSKDV